MRAETRELLEWVDREPRAYPDAIEVWRSTCPQHSVWEDALDEQLIKVAPDGAGARVVVTSRGRAALS
jgi:hypothetical protein